MELQRLLDRLHDDIITLQAQVRKFKNVDTEDKNEFLNTLVDLLTVNDEILSELEKYSKERLNRDYRHIETVVNLIKNAVRDVEKDVDVRLHENYEEIRALTNNIDDELRTLRKEIHDNISKQTVTGLKTLLSHVNELKKEQKKIEDEYTKLFYLNVLTLLFVMVTASVTSYVGIIASVVVIAVYTYIMFLKR